MNVMKSPNLTDLPTEGEAVLVLQHHALDGLIKNFFNCISSCVRNVHSTCSLISFKTIILSNLYLILNLINLLIL